MLTELGDDIATPRPVTHQALFVDELSANEAAAELAAQGFGTAVERDDEGEFALIASRVDPVAPPALHDLTWLVKERVELRGGSYGGWTCQTPA
jgi:hypothetical protein